MAFCLLLLPQTAGARKLDLSGLKLAFEEDFSDLSVSAHGPGTIWTAHTPWGGDFGDAQFSDPKPGFPFSVSGEGFRIELRKTNGRWRSGLLASVDSLGRGFSLRYGYFEMRAKLPDGPGIWPAFWLDSLIPAASTDPSVEIDVMEHYGQFPEHYNSTLTVWPKLGSGKKRSEMNIVHVPSGTLSNQFHTYGVEVGPEWTAFYFDRTETWRTHTPSDHKQPLMILVDLGLGGGWPIDRTPSPRYMYIDYVRAYARLPKPGLHQ